MPLRHLLYRCPACGADPTRGRDDRVTCPACGAVYERSRGAAVAEELPGEGRRLRPATELVDAIAGMGGPVPAATGPGGALGWKARVLARRAPREEPVRHRGALLGYAERFGPAVAGTLLLGDDFLELSPDPGREGGEARRREAPARRWRLLDLGSLQTSSKEVQVTPPGEGVVSLRFPEDSPRRWESLLEHALGEAYRRAGRGEILEFQPRIVTR